MPNPVARRRMAKGQGVRAAQFAGSSNQFLTRADNAALSMGAGVTMTLCGWLYPTSVAAQSQVISKFTGAAAGSEYTVQLSTAAVAVLRVSDGTTLRSSNGVTLALNQWSFFMGQYDGTNLYASRNAGAFTAAATGADIQNGVLALRLGTDSNALNGFTGSLSQVGIWKRALTTAEITTLYNGGKGQSYAQLPAGLLTNLVAYWDLDDAGGSAATWLDKASTNHLTAGTGAAAPLATLLPR
jgi:hypothetical protein